MSLAKRVLITGIQGFTGRYLAEALRVQGAEVFGTGSATLDEPGYFQADLRDTEALCAALKACRPHWVVHLAAIAYVGHGQPSDFYEVNLLGTRNLLCALDDSGIEPERLLVSSSANIYGNAQVELLSEDTPPAPANDYAVSKLSMEYVARLWGERYPLLITRPFNYTGVGQSTDFVLPKVIKHFREHAPRIEVGNIEVWREFNDVRYIVDAYRRLLEAGVTGVVNVCSGQTHCLRDVITTCVRLSGHELEVQVNPRFVRANEVPILRGDTQRLVSLIGPLDAPSLESTLAWMLSS